MRNKEFTYKPCEECGIEMIIFTYNKDKRFCSKECQHKKVECKCDYCDSTIAIKKSRFKNHKHNFCSNDCRVKYRKKNRTSKENNKAIEVKTKCCNCEKYFEGVRNENKYYFCSMPCYREYRKLQANILYIPYNLKDKINTNCAICNNVFEIPEWRFKEHGEHTCSPKCRARFVGNKTYTGNRKISLMVRSMVNYINWRTTIFVNAKNKCDCCNKKPDHVHHKKELYKIILENNIKTVLDAEKCNELWDINNGVAVCSICHWKLHSFKRKIKATI